VKGSTIKVNTLVITLRYGAVVKATQIIVIQHDGSIHTSDTKENSQLEG